MTKFDPTTLEIYRALYTSVAEEMGTALRRTSFSPNIKERRDYSCAVFDQDGRVIAQGDHMPVHLGSMPMAVAAALSEVEIGPGDVVALNDPFAGGTHLPDVTLVAGVFAEKAEGKRQKAARKKPSSAYCLVPTARCLFYVANRAHHADIGGATPGSMGLATDIYGEGVRIPPIRIVRGGELCEDVMKLILANVRSSNERRADFEAQIGSLKTGASRLLEIVERRGAKEAREYAAHLISYSSRMMRHAILSIPDGSYKAEDALDDDGISAREIPIRVRITIKGDRARVDFTGTAPQVSGAVNAVEAITASAVSYVFPLSGRRRHSGQRRSDGADRSNRAAGHGRQRCSSGVGRRRKCRDVAAHCRCRFQGFGAGNSGSDSGCESGNDEQPHHRRP